ncbi:MAG TPA: hypothetical protein VNA27_16840, partial [Rubrobacteraceae bacterium]|nr:hypothetical protein [Rubrobacteraceae bacterium]
RRTPPPSGNRLNDQVLEEGGISEEQMRHYQVGAVITSLRKLIEYSENRLAEDDYYTLERLHELLELDNEYWYAYGFTVRPRIEEWASPAQLDELMHLDKHLIAVRRRIRQAHKVLLAQERDPGKVERFRAKQVNLQEREKQHERFLAMGTGA